MQQITILYLPQTVTVVNIDIGRNNLKIQLQPAIF